MLDMAAEPQLAGYMDAEPIAVHTFVQNPRTVVTHAFMDACLSVQLLHARRFLAANPSCVSFSCGVPAGSNGTACRSFYS